MEVKPRSGAARSSATSSDDGSAGLIAPTVLVGSGPYGDNRERDSDDGRDQATESAGYDSSSGDGFGDATWSGGDGWTGGGSWGGDSTWSGSDGGGGGGSGWSGGDGGGWSGGDSGGGGGDSGGGGSS
ncbi:hypothetical protein AB1046_03960 [Promicromonospora sp. Populi]|uniref:hypothetical protein n=1 Tax=Promicromonospora sp. Populi TaxID=3239420 RepID=UPI0034E2F3DB